jgi:hypothetical protein
MRQQFLDTDASYKYRKELPVNKKMKPTVPEIRISSRQDVHLLVSQE